MIWADARAGAQLLGHEDLPKQAPSQHLQEQFVAGSEIALFALTGTRPGEENDSVC